MRRTPSPFSPDSNLPDVVAQDIGNQVVEDRHIADNEIRPLKIATVEAQIAVPFRIVKDVTTGAASVPIFASNAPFKLLILDVAVEPRGASTNGTMKITDGTNDITNAMVAASDKTMVRAGTIDNAYSTIAAGGSLAVVCAGDTVANTIGLVTITAVKID